MACSSTPPRPPSSEKKARPKVSIITVKNSPGADADHGGMQRQRRGAVAIAGAERAADRGGNAAAHRARRHHLRQHHERKHQRDAGQRLGAEPADIGGLGNRNQRGAEHRDRIGDRELQQGRQDRRRQQAVGRRRRNGRGAQRRAGRQWSCVTGSQLECNRLWTTYYLRACAGASHPSPRRGHHGRPHRSMVPSRGLRGEIEHVWRHRFEADPSPRLLGIDLALERMPAARLVECEIVRFAEQQRESTASWSRMVWIAASSAMLA